MGSKVEYVDSTQMYATSYARNSKAVAVLWGVFTLCYAVICLVAFATPEWLGTTSSSGRIGVWTICNAIDAQSGIETCIGKLEDVTTIPGVALRSAAILVGLGTLLSLVCVLALLLFFFCGTTSVFMICGWIQLFSAILIGAGVIVFPAGWDTSEVRLTCGSSAGQYALGDCSVRWALVLAVIGCLDGVILASLAFILATRHVRLRPDPGPGLPYKGEINGAFLNDAQSLSGSRKAINMQPVMLMQPSAGDADRYSEFSNRTGRSKASGYRGDYSSSVQNFQL
ncbi:LHFPL tetraspan subfamily member 3 protein [Cloeon dipterum]|uniref:LHFPL tetraspan subfamily member 3 protein n=1 Tax=Cloeon dipterum TaxID=197152 RepID=UPI0032207719